MVNLKRSFRGEFIIEEMNLIALRLLNIFLLIFPSCYSRYNFSFACILLIETRVSRNSLSTSMR